MTTSSLARRANHPDPTPKPRLSDHALLRYLERVHGVDIAAARREVDERLLQSEGARILLKFAKNAPFKIRDRHGNTFCGRDQVITTCYRRTADASRSGKSPTRRNSRDRRS